MFPILENTANEFVSRVKKLTKQDTIEDINNNTNQKGKFNIKIKDNSDGNNNSSVDDLINFGVDINLIEHNKVAKDTCSMTREDHKTNVNAKKDSVKVDAEKLVGGYTADAIVPCAFGLKSNVMYNSKDPFAVALYAFYEMTWFNIFEKYVIKIHLCYIEC